jgi:hypothetical protein
MADETTLSLRGGRFAVCRQRAGRLEKQSNEWACRTESTGLYPPSVSDFETVEKFVNNLKRPYLIGSAPLPYGFCQPYDVGTAGELTLAYRMGIPVYLVLAMPPAAASSWILGCATEVFGDFDALKKHLRTLHDDSA